MSTDSECGWFCLILVGAVAFAIPLVLNAGLWNRGFRFGLTMILTGVGIIALICAASAMPPGQSVGISLLLLS
jgi:hypothetical protein